MQALTERQIDDLMGKVISSGEASLLCADLNGQLRYANVNACTRLGYGQVEMLQKSIFDYTPRESPALWQGHCKRVLANGHDRIYAYHEECSGTLYPVEIFSVPHTVEESQEQIICSIVQDAQNCRRYKGMLEIVENSQRIGSFDFRLQSQSILASDNLLAIMGCDDPDQLKPVNMTERLNKTEADRWNGQMIGFISGHHRMDEQFTIATNDGRQSLMRVVMWSTFQDGQVSGITGYYEVLDEHSNEEFISLEEANRRHIRRALNYTNGRVTGPNGAGRLLGINGKTLFARMKKLGINRDDFTK